MHAHHYILPSAPPESTYTQQCTRHSQHASVHDKGRGGALEILGLGKAKARHVFRFDMQQGQQRTHDLPPSDHSLPNLKTQVTRTRFHTRRHAQPSKHTIRWKKELDIKTISPFHAPMYKFYATLATHHRRREAKKNEQKLPQKRPYLSESQKHYRAKKTRSNKKLEPPAS